MAKEISKEEHFLELIKDREELLNKIHELNDFIEKVIDQDFDGRCKKQLELLTKQAKAMYDYWLALNLRIYLMR